MAELKDIFRELGAKKGNPEWYKLCVSVEAAALKVFASLGKEKIRPNIDFYSGSVYHIMGFPHDLFTPLLLSPEPPDGALTSLKNVWDSHSQNPRYTGQLPSTSAITVASWGVSTFTRTSNIETCDNPSLSLPGISE